MAPLPERSLVASSLAKRRGVIRTLVRRVLRSLAEHDLSKRSVVKRYRVEAATVEPVTINPALSVLMPFLMRNGRVDRHLPRGEHIQRGRAGGAAAEDVDEWSVGRVGRRPIRVIGPVIRRLSFAQYRDARHARVS